MRPLRVVLCALALVVAGLPGADAMARRGAPCGYFQLETLHVEGKVMSKTVRRGGFVTVKVTVTRPGHQDPAGLGVEWGRPPASVPAEGVDTTASFWAGETYLFNRTLTNSDGKGTIRVPVPNYAATGVVDLELGAHYYHNRGGCPDGEESGYNVLRDAFKIV